MNLASWVSCILCFGTTVTMLGGCASTVTPAPQSGSDQLHYVQLLTPSGEVAYSGYILRRAAKESALTDVIIMLKYSPPVIAAQDNHGRWIEKSSIESWFCLIPDMPSDASSFRADLIPPNTDNNDLYLAMNLNGNSTWRRVHGLFVSEIMPARVSKIRSKGRQDEIVCVLENIESALYSTGRIRQQGVVMTPYFP